MSNTFVTLCEMLINKKICLFVHVSSTNVDFYNVLVNVEININYD